MLRAAICIWSGLLLVSPGDIYETRYKYEKLFKRIDGFERVTVAGVDGKMQIAVTVRDNETKGAMAVMLKNGKLDGHEIRFIVSGRKKPVRPTVAEDRETEKKPSDTVAKPKKSEDEDPYDDCDFVRKMMKMKAKFRNGKDLCHQRIVTTTDQKRIGYATKQGFPMWASREMPGATCYLYLKHRKDCPVGRYKDRVKAAADGLTRKPVNQLGDKR